MSQGFGYLYARKIFRLLKLMFNLVICVLVVNMLAGWFQPAVLFRGMHDIFILSICKTVKTQDMVVEECDNIY